jgi:hypothetical protein
LSFLQERDPFAAEKDLVSLATGEVADEKVNVHQAYAIGEKQIQEMCGQDVYSFSYKRKSMAVTMKTKSTVSIEGENVLSELLFQRLIAVYNIDELSTAFGFELSTRPMSLFDKENLMREADKPPLKNAIGKLSAADTPQIPTNVKYVLDGGSLLHKVQ